MIRRVLVKTILCVFALAAVLCLFAIVFRDPATGGYSFAGEAGQGNMAAEDGFVSVPPLLPVMKVYGAQGEAPLTVALLPVARLAVPLIRGGPFLRYDMTTGGAMTLRPFSSQAPVRHLDRLPPEETAVRLRAWQSAHEERAAQMQALASAGARVTGWVSPLGDGPATLVLPEDYVYRRGVVETLDVSDDSFLQFDRAGGRALPDLAHQFRDRFGDFTRSDDDVFIAQKRDGSFFLQAVRRVDNDTWLLTGTARDFDTAVTHMGIIRSLGDDGLAWNLVGGDADYLRSPVLHRFPAYQDQVNRIFAGWLSSMLTPDMVVLDTPFQERSLTADVKNDAGGELYNTFSIRLRLPEQGGNLTWDDSKVLAEAADQPVQVAVLPATGGTPALCVAQGLFPLVPAGNRRTLALQIFVRSASLPDCQLAAQALTDFGRSDFTAKIDLEAIAPLGDYFGRFDYAVLDDDGLLVLRRGQAGAVIRRTGEAIIPLTENTLFSVLTDDVLAGTSTDPETPGVTLYDLHGDEIVALDYAALYQTDRSEGIWRDIFQTEKGGKYGLYDLQNRREIALNRYDRFNILPGWNLILAHRGDAIDVLKPDGTEIVSGGVSDYIFADPMRSRPPEDDFLAVKSIAEGNWRFLTKKQIPLLDGVFADVERLPRPVGRAFVLTEPDGEKRYIEVTRDGRVEAIAAPEEDK